MIQKILFIGLHLMIFNAFNYLYSIDNEQETEAITNTRSKLYLDKPSPTDPSPPLFSSVWPYTILCYRQKFQLEEKTERSSEINQQTLNQE